MLLSYVQPRSWWLQAFLCLKHHCLHPPKVPSDACLLRFLRARDFNIEKAREMLSHSLIWRKKNQIDKIMNEYQINQVVKDYFPGGWHHQDKGEDIFLFCLFFMIVICILLFIGVEIIIRKFEILLTQVPCLFRSEILS